MVSAVIVTSFKLRHSHISIRDYVRGGLRGLKPPRNWGVQRREQKEKQTIYY